MPVRPSSAASTARSSATMKRSPFELTDPELMKKPTLRRPKPNTPILNVKKGTKELDAQMAAMQARLTALKAEAAAATKQTDEIKRRTEEVLRQRMSGEAGKGTDGMSANASGDADDDRGAAGVADMGPPTPPPEVDGEAPTVKTGGAGWGVKGAASITDKKTSAAGTAGAAASVGKSGKTAAASRPGSAAAARANARASKKAAKIGGATASTTSAMKKGTAAAVKPASPAGSFNHSQTVRGGRAAESGSPAKPTATEVEADEEEGVGDDPGGFFVCETGAGSWS